MHACSAFVKPHGSKAVTLLLCWGPISRCTVLIVLLPTSPPEINRSRVKTHQPSHPPASGPGPPAACVEPSESGFGRRYCACNSALHEWLANRV
ncbi:hypothetical protein IWZ00DRAFT_182112 [Phyllosticta capitalensis]